MNRKSLIPTENVDDVSMALRVQCQYCVPFGNSQHPHEVTMLCQIITPAPGMKQVLDKPGSCGQYENYQRPEGFPVGKTSNTWRVRATCCVPFCRNCICEWLNRTQYGSPISFGLIPDPHGIQKNSPYCRDYQSQCSSQTHLTNVQRMIRFSVFWMWILSLIA